MRVVSNARLTASLASPTAIDDEAAIEDLARRFSVLVDAWRAAKANQGAALTA